MDQDHNISSEEGNTWFQPTHWSLVLAVSRGDTVLAATARETLCRTYWSAIYSFIRRHGRSIEDAEDLTQDFFCRHLVEKNAFKGLDPQRGKFRNFLRTALRNYLANDFDRNQAQKRNSGQRPVPLEDAEKQYQAFSVNNDTADRIFDRQWAMAIMDRAFQRLRAKRTANGQGALFEALKEFLSRNANDGECDALAERFHLQREAVKMAVSRLRKAYKALVRDEIRQTVEDPKEVDDELRYFIEVISG
jgi:RNA polymerase sigma factor (sigma-70 family)